MEGISGQSKHFSIRNEADVLIKCAQTDRTTVSAGHIWGKKNIFGAPKSALHKMANFFFAHQIGGSEESQ